MNDKCKELFSLHTLLHIYFHLCIPSASTEMNWIKVHLFCIYSKEVATDSAAWTQIWPCLVNNCLTIFDPMGSAVFHMAQAKLWSTFLEFNLQGTRYLVKSECSKHRLVSVVPHCQQLRRSLSIPPVVIFFFPDNSLDVFISSKTLKFVPFQVPVNTKKSLVCMRLIWSTSVS